MMCFRFFFFASFIFSSSLPHSQHQLTYLFRHPPRFSRSNARMHILYMCVKFTATRYTSQVSRNTHTRSDSLNYIFDSLIQWCSLNVHRAVSGCKTVNHFSSLKSPTLHCGFYNCQFRGEEIQRTSRSRMVLHKASQPSCN